jgi:hypothetical protein
VVSAIHRCKAVSAYGVGVLMLSALLASPAAAQPPSCDDAPPGVAAVDQYCESTPGTRGTPRDDDGAGPAGPSDAERRVRGESGGVAVIESLPAGAAGSAGRGDSPGTSGGDDGGRRAGEGRPGVGSGVPGSDRPEAPPGDAASGLASAGSSLWFGEMRWVIVLLGLTLVAAVALGARRRAPAD